MRRWNISFCMILLGAITICAGCKSKPTRPVDAPTDNRIDAEMSIYEDVEFVEVASDKSNGTKPTSLAPAKAPKAKPKKIAGTADQDAVKTAALNFVKSIKTNNKNLFMNSVVATPQTKPALTTMFEGMAAIEKFHQAIIKTYGADKLQSKSKSPTPEEIKASKITIKGNTAQIKPKNNTPLSLVKQNGKWKVDVLSPIPKAQLPMAMMMMKQMKSAADKARKNVGKKGYTAERIEKEFSASMMGAR